MDAVIVAGVVPNSTYPSCSRWEERDNAREGTRRAGGAPERSAIHGASAPCCKRGSDVAPPARRLYRQRLAGDYDTVQQGGAWTNYHFTVITPVLSSISQTSGSVATQATFTGTGFGTTRVSARGVRSKPKLTTLRYEHSARCKARRQFR
ncbi:MAG TPA: hypothetical protein VHX14_09020, partial [Thermoanaerobaculia bacterium]|nr:hypothetical protein [Thermoanaerobaculia bacterium]